MLGISRSKFAGVCAAFIMSWIAVPDVFAATMKVTADTPVSFRATFEGIDTDPASIDGNDYQVFTFNFWTVLVNLRGDSVDAFGNGAGFYEIQLTHTGLLDPHPKAPVVNTFLFYGGLQPDVTLTDKSVASQPNGSGSEYLSTTVNITLGKGQTTFAGSIAGDSDLDGDGKMDTVDTDVVVDTLRGLKDVGIITGKEMGQIIKQTKQPIKQ